jgi:hypothetical protein
MLFINKKGLPVWKLAYSFSVYIILPENTHQYLYAAADNSPWNIFHSRKTFLAYSFSVYIILPENTHQYVYAAADNSPWNIFHSRFAIFRRHF